MAARVDIRHEKARQDDPASFRGNHEPVIEPLARSLPTNGAGEFQDLVCKPAPPSQHIRLARCCAFSGTRVRF